MTTKKPANHLAQSQASSRDAFLKSPREGGRRDAGIADLSTIILGAVLTVDVVLAAPKERAAMERDLRLLAVGSGS